MIVVAVHLSPNYAKMVQFSTRACCPIEVISLKVIDLILQNKIEQQKLPFLSTFKIKETQRRVEHIKQQCRAHIAHFTAIKALLGQKFVSRTGALL